MNGGLNGLSSSTELIHSKENADGLGNAFSASGIGRVGGNCSQSFCCEIQEASTGREQQTRCRQSTVGRQLGFVVITGSKGCRSLLGLLWLREMASDHTSKNELLPMYLERTPQERLSSETP